MDYSFTSLEISIEPLMEVIKSESSGKKNLGMKQYW